jgi:hypothetical protein
MPLEIARDGRLATTTVVAVGHLRYPVLLGRIEGPNDVGKLPKSESSNGERMNAGPNTPIGEADGD